ncbi:hypothetical protein NADFUDRAFT_80950 [Nadsonia fulvescens var. elongata DSM 6958]|uniref:Uncharacterized protein n=1 Tax=Nadsonia fulvescens var. elongata DSM 6958 TaxID=857566 RepID=A0A1E3PQV4_9ASCO|nr:hypothetical protein NADFUDRAFT_80950 [Nadsonia fulvescens var. elongata DSM 6958]
MSAPSTLPTLLASRFKQALASGHLIHSASTVYRATTPSGINVIYTVAPSLAHKPSASSDASSQAPKDPRDPSNNPFLIPDENLTIVDQLDDDAGLRIVLNKFSIVPCHFLLATRDWQSQSSALTPSQLFCSFKILHALAEPSPDYPGEDFIGFYNCGPNSGSSIDHKHVQFLPLPFDPVSSDPTVKSFSNFVDQTLHDQRDYASQYKDGQTPLSCPDIPFEHYIVPVDSHILKSQSRDDIEDTLGFRFSTLLSRTMTQFRRCCMASNQNHPVSYNLVFTRRWMMAVPRTQADYQGLSINATGTLGMLLAKSEAEHEKLLELGPLNVLEQVGLKREHFEDDIDYDY